MKIKYNLSKTELDYLKLVCRYTNLSFHAQAARPKIARQLIKSHLPAAKLAFGAI